MNERRTQGRPIRPGRLLWHALAVCLSVLFLLPLASMFVGSLRLPGLPPPRGIEWLPKPLAWGNYVSVFHVPYLELGRYALNTLVVESLAVPMTLLAASWAVFALDQLPARFARCIISASLLLLLL